uniref:DUF4175 family protein n=1 Tax=candidate division WOR-3 bacterium TaxID=2052148 RepID=A0A7C4TH33_UNCW3
MMIERLKSYSYKQSLIDLLALLFFTSGTIIIAITISLFLLKSPFYGLIGIFPVFFYRQKRFIDKMRILDRRINFQGELVSGIQLSSIEKEHKENYSVDLISAFVSNVFKKLNGIDLNRYLSYENLNRSIIFFLITVALFLSYPAFFPQRFWFSLNHRIDFQVEPRSKSLIKGTEIKLKLSLFSPYLPKSVLLILQEEGNSRIEKVKVQNGIAEKKIILEKPLSFYFKFFMTETEVVKLQILEPLFLKHLEFHLKYPEYTGLKEETQFTRQIVAPAKTEVFIKGLASQILNLAILEYQDTTELNLQGNEFSGRFTIQSSDNAFLYLKGTTELKEPITIYAVPDLPPIVEIFYPNYNINLPNDMNLTLGIKCSDDYGISAVSLCYEFKETKRIVLKINCGIEDTIYYDWNLTNLKMLPGEEISYYVEAKDNAGQISRSKSYYIYFPTMEQIYEEVAGKETQVQSDLNALQEIYKDNIEEVKRIEEKLKKERELSPLDRERLKEVIGKEEQVLKKISEWERELQQTIEKLKEGIVLDQKSLERLQEIMKILKEIAPDELRQALENLKLELNKSPEEIREALKNLKELQEEFARALERTLEILKRYQEEEKLRELAERARELADEAKEINEDKMAKEGKRDSLTEEIDHLAQEIERLAEEQGLEQNIATSLKEIAQNAKEASASAQKDLSQTEMNLEKIAQDLQKLYESLTKSRHANLRKNLLETLNRLIEISKLEEEMVKKEKFDADLQSELINATKETAESLYAQQVKSLYVTPQMGKRLAKAIKEMENGMVNEIQGRAGRNNLREAMRQLNLASLEILESLKKASETAGSSTGMDQFLKSLSEITQGQSSLNQSMFSIFPIPVSGLTKEQMSQISRLAGKQRELRQALEALKETPGAGKYQELLDELGKEMKEIEEALYQYKLDRKLIERQQMIISRLLDAERSIRQEDWTKERKSRPGKDIIRPSPAQLPQELGRDELREIIQRALREPYPKEYEIYIREYFKRLLEVR